MNNNNSESSNNNEDDSSSENSKNNDDHYYYDNDQDDGEEQLHGSTDDDMDNTMEHDVHSGMGVSMVPYSTILQQIQAPINHQQQQQRNRNDPKSIRLAAVTCAICDIIVQQQQQSNHKNDSSSNIDITPKQMYAQAIITLEGTIKVDVNNNNTGTSIIDTIQDTLATMNALLELIIITIPYIVDTNNDNNTESSSSSSSSGNSSIIGHTFTSFTSRILRAVIQSTLSYSTIIQMSQSQQDTNNNSNNNNGIVGTTALLRNTCTVCCLVLQHLPPSSNGINDSSVQQFIQDTLLLLFCSNNNNNNNDSSIHIPPKVRKAAMNGLIDLVMISKTKLIHKSICKTIYTYIMKEMKYIISQSTSNNNRNNNTSVATDGNNNKYVLQRCLHLIPFIEGTISNFHLNYHIAICDIIMTYLTQLIHQTSSSMSTSSTTNDYYIASNATMNNNTVVKVKEMTPKILVIASILNLLWSILQHEHDTSSGNSNNNSNSNEKYSNNQEQVVTNQQQQFAQRVLASMIQNKSHLFILLIDHQTNIEYDIMIKTRILLGQVIIASIQCIGTSINMENHDSVSTPSTSSLLSSEAATFDLLCKLLPLAVQAIVQLCKPSDDIIQSKMKHGSDSNDVIGQTLFTESTQLFRTIFPILIGQYEINKNGNQCTLEKCVQDIMQFVSASILSDSSYRCTWHVSLPMVAILIQQVYTIMENNDSTRATLSYIIESIISQHNINRNEIENALSIIIQGVGIETSWKWIQWKTTSNDNRDDMIISIERAWILSTMKRNASITTTTTTRMEFFQKDILSMARKCDTLHKSSTHPHHRAAARTRVIELWSLFPCFCYNVSSYDMINILPSLTITLGRILEDKRYPEIVTVISFGLTVLVKSIEDNGGRELESMSDESKVLSETAKSLLPVLFKFVNDTHDAASSIKSKHTNERMDIDETPSGTIASSSLSNPMDNFQKLQSVSDAISALARFAPDGFLKGLFKKTMQRLLEEVQSDSGDSERICALLTLSQALVASKVLDEATITFLYRALKPLIKNDTDGARIQKRAYKVLNELCECYHTFITETDRLNELSQLLTGAIGTAQISARYMRLKCFNIIVDGFHENDNSQLNTLYKAIPEILLCLKDSNRKTRDTAYQLIISMAVRGNIVEFVKVTLAALGSETSHMRSAVVMALSRLVFEQGWANDEFHALLPSLLKTILVLIHEGSREVIKSVVGFIRICVAAIPSEQLEPLVPELIGSLLKSQQAKSRFRAKIKIILKKLVKLYGYDALLPHVPASETRLLTHMRKLDQREKRKKDTARNERAAGKLNAEDYDAMFESDEDDSDDGRTFMTGATGLTTRRTKMVDGDQSINSKRSKTTTATSKTSKSKLPMGPALRISNEMDGEVVDLLDPGITKKVQFQSQNDNDDSDSDDDSAEMTFDDDGKLIIHDDDDEDRKSTTVEMDDEMVPMNTAKRRRLMSSSSQSTSKGESRTVGSKDGKRNSKKKNTTSNAIGASYRSKKAGGDVMKKGAQYEPYAFVPLDGRAYTKKHRRTTVEQMSTVVRKGGGGGNKKNFRSNKRKR